MQLSIWIVTALIILVMFGAGQKFLDKMRLSDRWALIILVSIVIGLIIPPIHITKNFSFSIGGFLIPFGLCIYLLIRAGWSTDLLRALVGTVLTASAILLLEIFLPSETPESIVIDNTYLYGVVAGLIAYALGRSRRNAFVCSVFGITLASVAVYIYNISVGATDAVLALGASTAFDTIILSILISVGLTELIGKTAEIAVGKQEKAYNYETGSFVNTDNLSHQDNELEEIEDVNTGDKNHEN